MDRKAEATISSGLRLARGPKWQQPKPDGVARRMAEPTADPAFVKHVQDVGEQLVDATWSPSEYEYAVVELPVTLAAAGAARDWATAASVTRSLEEAERGDVMLAISELVTNAVRHVNYGPGEYTVSLAVGVATLRLRIEVCDPGTGFSIEGMDARAPDAPDGRGLLIVDAIALRWGASRGDRHCVWMEIKR
jgi:anti-sigma regulatory factor (Ser/Thr protein kinase)